jgi:hypothetical protein
MISGERKTPRTAVPSTMHLAANRATFGMEVRVYPKSPLWNISEMQADELAYEKSMYGADSVVTAPNGWPAQNTSCRNHPRKSTSASLSSVSACPSFPMSKP